MPKVKLTQEQVIEHARMFPEEGSEGKVAAFRELEDLKQRVLSMQSKIDDLEEKAEGSIFLKDTIDDLKEAADGFALIQQSLDDLKDRVTALEV